MNVFCVCVCVLGERKKDLLWEQYKFHCELSEGKRGRECRALGMKKFCVCDREIVNNTSHVCFLKRTHSKYHLNANTHGELYIVVLAVKMKHTQFRKANYFDKCETMEKPF